MAVNKPAGDNAREALSKRSQLEIKLIEKTAWAKRNKKRRSVHDREEEREEVQGSAA